MTLNEKMRLATTRNTQYETRSSLIPQELQDLVKFEGLTVPSTIMSLCLRFLSFFHLNNTESAQNALKCLQLAVENVRITKYRSVSLTIVGICNELLGDKKEAEDWYDEALLDEEMCKLAYIKKVGISPDTKVFVVGRDHV